MRIIFMNLLLKIAPQLVSIKPKSSYFTQSRGAAGIITIALDRLSSPPKCSRHAHPLISSHLVCSISVY